MTWRLVEAHHQGLHTNVEAFGELSLIMEMKPIHPWYRNSGYSCQTSSLPRPCFYYSKLTSKTNSIIAGIFSGAKVLHALLPSMSSPLVKTQTQYNFQKVEIRRHRNLRCCLIPHLKTLVSKYWQVTFPKSQIVGKDSSLSLSLSLGKAYTLSLFRFDYKDYSF